jgi:phenylacetate-coenzyme A ligase PaaK-like adenylate-forming protein
MMKTSNMTNKCYLFGKEIAAEQLDSELVAEIIADAQDHAAAAAKPDVECILDVLQCVSECWEDPDYHLRKKAARILPGMIDFSKEMVNEGFGVISAICRRENLEKRLIGELGHRRILDEWVGRPDLAYDLKAVPRGVLLHLTAGNVFVGAVDSLVSGIITKNANILKMSRVDPVFPLLFLESIKENDPDGIIWPHQAALLWKGGDERIENPLLQAQLTVIFWGGHEALASVKKRLGNATHLIENGPRYSFAVISGTRIKKGLDKQVIRGLALDLCRWDQQACSSPHVVYILDQNEKPAHQFIEQLYDELIELKDELPVGRLSFDEKVEIRKVRELARMAQARNEARLVCPEDFAFSIVYEKDPEFKISCLNRTLFVKRVAGVDEMIAKVAPLANYLQTVGLCLEDDILDSCQQELINIGARRITEVGGMSEGHDGAPHEGAFLLRQLVEWVDLEYGRGHISRIERLLGRITDSPYYGSIIAKAGGSGFENFLKLPLLDRDTFYRNSPPESEAILTGPMTDAYIYASGGTTGNPKFTFYSNREYRYVTDVLTDIYRNAGLCETDRVANLFIAGNLWTSFNVAGRALENLGCLHLPVGGASDFENILKYLQTFKVNAVVGLPSIIIKLAEEIQRRGLDIRIEKILYGGEHLRPQTCEFLKAAIGAVSIRSAGYACVDTGPIGWQCDFLEGSAHHVLDQYSYAEIIDSKTLKPVSDDLPGEIVATNLDRTLMPVVRYRTGDLGRWVEVECPCGFRGKTFELLGRCDDLLVIGGINLMPVDVAAGLSDLPVSQSFQLVARTSLGKDLLIIRLEAEAEIPDARVVEALKKGSYKIAESLHEGWMNLEIEWHKPGMIKRNDRTGKIKTVVDERY